MSARKETRSNRLTTTRVGESAWIFRPEGALEHDSLEQLRRAFREALARGAADIVVDLEAASRVSAEAATALSAIADALVARDGLLWISMPWRNGDGFVLRPIRNGGLDGLLDVGALVDEATTARRSAGLIAGDESNSITHGQEVP